MALQALSKRQFLVTIQGLSGNWSARTGGHKTVAVTKAFDGGTATPFLLPANPLIDDMTVSRPFVAGRDDTMFTNLISQVGTWYTTIAQQPTDPSYAPGGNLATWGALLSGVQLPELDANADAIVLGSLVFAVASLA